MGGTRIEPADLPLVTTSGTSGEPIGALHRGGRRSGTGGSDAAFPSGVEQGMAHWVIGA